jgi:hypothetical protein
MRRSVILTLSAAALLVPALAGCSAIESSVRDGVEQAITDASGGKLDVNLKEGVPEGFPSDVVPLVEGSTVGALSQIGGKDVWVITVQTPNSGSAARDALVAAGFAVDAEASTGEGSLVTLSSDAYDVKVVVTAESVLYTISAR